MSGIVIIGAGQAGLQAAGSARQAGFSGPLTIIGAEPQLPYQRPPLSKAYLQGDLAAERLFLRPREFYVQSRIDLKLGARALAVDRLAQEVRLATGEVLAYDRLLIATGAPPRRIAVAGGERRGVFYLRTVADSDALRPVLDAGGTLAVIGAGYIGLEVAASARKAGLKVVVIEAQDRPLARVAGRDISDYFVDLHRRNGVEFRFGAAVEAIDGLSESADCVRLAGGEHIACDAVLIGVGVAPDATLARGAGLAVRDGVVVDEQARTDDPAIFAAGDCASFPSPLYGRRMRLESVPNAIEQGKVAGANLAGGQAVYDAVPWFWSDQYETKLQTAGLCEGADETVIRRAGPQAFAAWYLKEGRLIAVDAVNDVAAFAAGKRLIAAKARPAPKTLADPAADLKSLAL
jgi:3-phenylpropionate/trans-cinnamate dioxygenase ferredoxin reductase subunit